VFVGSGAGAATQDPAPTSPQAAIHLATKPEAELTSFERTMIGISDIAERTIDQSVARACRARGIAGTQRDTIRNAIVAEWRGIMDPNDPTVRDLVLGYLSMRTADAPPRTETVKAWGRHAATLRNKHAARLSKKKETLLGEKDPKRRAQLELEVAVMSALDDLSRDRIERWAAGDFDPGVFWQAPLRRPITGDAPPVQQQPRRTADRQPTPTPQDPISVELARWTRYVTEFIRRFALDGGQRDAAQSCLSELSSRAAAHRERYREQIADLERRMQSKKTSPQIEADIQKDLIRLYGPIDDMFAELRARLDQIPTNEQKKHAASVKTPQPKPTP